MYPLTMSFWRVGAFLLAVFVAPTAWVVGSAVGSFAGSGPVSALVVLVIAGVLYNQAKPPTQ